MVDYPDRLVFFEWFNIHVAKLPENKVIRTIYLPFYLLGSLFLLVTMGLGTVLLYIITFPFYILYFLTYNTVKEINLNKTLILYYDKEGKGIKTSINNIKRPEKEGYRFFRWTSDGTKPVGELWKLPNNTKIYAHWFESSYSKNNAPKNKNQASKTNSPRKNISNINNSSSFEKMTIPQLKDIARKNNIKGFSTLNKKELVLLLKKELSNNKRIFEKIVGVTMDDNGLSSNKSNRQIRISKLKEGQNLKLVHEKNNKFDEHAILVTNELGEDLGYIPKTNNSNVLNYLNKNQVEKIIVSKIIGGKGKFYGLIIEIKLTPEASINEVKPINSKDLNQRKKSYTYNGSYYDSIDYDLYHDYLSSIDYSSYYDSIDYSDYISPSDYMDYNDYSSPSDYMDYDDYDISDYMDYDYNDYDPFDY